MGCAHTLVVLNGTVDPEGNCLDLRNNLIAVSLSVGRLRLSFKGHATGLITYNATRLLTAGEQRKRDQFWVPVEDQCFKTLGPGIDATFATAVTADSATLPAKIDPNGAQTGDYFQFGETPAYGQTQPAAPLSLGAGSGDVEVSQHLQRDCRPPPPTTTVWSRPALGND
jgi:hypothetical protein